MEARDPSRRTAVSARLSAGAFAILGLLTFGEQSGYDLKKFVDGSIAYFFSPAKSQIYAELRRLLDLGYVQERHVAQDDRPDKRLYRATPEGELALREWLERSPVERDTFRSSFLIKVFLGHLMEPEVLMAQLHEYRGQLEEELLEYRRLEEQIKDAAPAAFPYMTLRCGLIAVRASIRWTDEVIREVEGRIT